MKRAVSPVLKGVAIAAAIVIGLLAHERVRSRPYQSEQVVIAGVANAGRIGSHLLRGAQPSLAGFQALRALGVTSVINLTTGRDEVTMEQATVEGLGMEYIHLPWSAVHDPPAEHVRAFVDWLETHHDTLTFVHCKAGVDRTGTMVASYRLLAQGWSADAAVAEMDAFHFHWLLHPHLQRFVYALAAARDAGTAVHVVASTR
ncbi:MAG: dual specificity protein phosphatase family protein [Acidobacteriota bacterium]